jgi:hypothetical protein
MVVVVGEL